MLGLNDNVHNAQFEDEHYSENDDSDSSDETQNASLEELDELIRKEIADIFREYKDDETILREKLFSLYLCYAGHAPVGRNFSEDGSFSNKRSPKITNYLGASFIGKTLCLM